MFSFMNKLKYSTLIFIVIFHITVNFCDATCEKEYIINSQTDPDALDRLIKSWIGLSTECYFYIGKKFYHFFQQENNHRLKQLLLSESTKYLEFAKDNLSPYRNEYYECNALLIKVEVNSTEPNLQNIYSSIQVRGVRERIEYEYKFLILKEIQKHWKPFITYFLEMKLPHEYTIDLYHQLSNEKDHFIQRVEQVRTFKNSYESILSRLKINAKQNLIVDIENVLDLLKENQTMQGVQKYYDAFSKWHKLLVTIQQQKFPSRALERCRLYNHLNDQLESVRQTLPFVSDPENFKCDTEVACLANKYEVKLLMPEYNDSQLLNKKKACQEWINSYTKTLDQCNSSFTIEDKRPLLNEIIKVHNAIDNYQKKKSINALNSIHVATMNTSIKNLTGLYLANHYYQIIWSELENGPLNYNPFETLSNIGRTLDIYNRYSPFDIQEGKVDLNQQYSLLSRFFSNISSNLFVSNDVTDYMHKNFKQAWSVQRILDEHKRQNLEQDRSVEQLELDIMRMNRMP